MTIARKIALGIGWVLNALLWFWAGAKTTLDMISRGLAAEDFTDPHGLIARGLLWLFASPWWGPAAIAGILTLSLIAYLFWLGKGAQERAVAAATGEPRRSPQINERFPTVDWDKPLDNVFGQTYMNETVSMDGRHFIKCTFDNVTYLYNGTRPTELTDCKIALHDGKTNTAVNTDNPVIGNLIQLLNELGIFKTKLDFVLFNRDSR